MAKRKLDLSELKSLGAHGSEEFKSDLDVERRKSRAKVAGKTFQGYLSRRVENSGAIIVATLFGFTSQAFAQATAPEPATARTAKIVSHVASVSKTADLQYLVYLPKNYHKSTVQWPLLFWLHGDGGQADRGDLEEIRSYGPPALVEQGKDIPAIIVAPQLWGNIPWDADILHDLLQAVFDRYSVDRERVYLMGYSRGGFGAWELGVRYPEPFAAVVVISGRGMNSIERLRNAAVWIFHGELDEGVPVADAQSMFNELKATGGDVQLTIYPEIGHNALTPALANDKLWKWLFSQRRSPD